MKNSNEIIAQKLHSFINQILFFEKKNIFNFEGIKLYPSEIHLILIISEEPTNATQMAEKLNVTKGAVSQTISRLEKKGILIKTKDPNYKNELTLTFTKFGKQVFNQYKKMISTIDKQFIESISEYNAGEQKVIINFLDNLNKLFSNIG